MRSITLLRRIYSRDGTRAFYCASRGLRPASAIQLPCIRVATGRSAFRVAHVTRQFLTDHLAWALISIFGLRRSLWDPPIATLVTPLPTPLLFDTWPSLHACLSYLLDAPTHSLAAVLGRVSIMLTPAAADRAQLESRVT